MEQVAAIGVLDMSVAVSEHDFGDLLRPLIEPGFRLAFAMLHDPQAAEDVVQDASFTSVGRSTALDHRSHRDAIDIALVGQSAGQKYSVGPVGARWAAGQQVISPRAAIRKQLPNSDLRAVELVTGREAAQRAAVGGSMTRRREQLASA